MALGKQNFIVRALLCSVSELASAPDIMTTCVTKTAIL